MKVFDAGKTRMIGLPYAEKKLWRYVKPFLSDTGTLRTNRQTDGEICYINIARQYRPTDARVSIGLLTRDKNWLQTALLSDLQLFCIPVCLSVRLSVTFRYYVKTA